MTSDLKNSISIANSCFPYLGISCCKIWSDISKIEEQFGVCLCFFKVFRPAVFNSFGHNTSQADLSIRKQEDIQSILTWLERGHLRSLDQFVSLKQQFGRSFDILRRMVHMRPLVKGV